MPRYEAQVIVSLALEAPTDDRARALINGAQWPAGVTCRELDIRLRRMGSPDKRLIAHLPNLPKAQLRAAVAKLGPRRTLIVAACLTAPQHYHTIVQAIVQHPAFKDKVTSVDVAQDLAYLKNEGWIVPVCHNVELDAFLSLDVRAEFSALAQGAHA